MLESRSSRYLEHDELEPVDRLLLLLLSISSVSPSSQVKSDESSYLLDQRGPDSALERFRPNPMPLCARICHTCTQRQSNLRAAPFPRESSGAPTSWGGRGDAFKAQVRERCGSKPPLGDFPADHPEAILGPSETPTCELCTLAWLACLLSMHCPSEMRPLNCGFGSRRVGCAACRPVCRQGGLKVGCPQH